MRIAPLQVVSQGHQAPGYHLKLPRQPPLGLWRKSNMKSPARTLSGHLPRPPGRRSDFEVKLLIDVLCCDPCRAASDGERGRKRRASQAPGNPAAGVELRASQILKVVVQPGKSALGSFPSTRRTVVVAASGEAKDPEGARTRVPARFTLRNALQEHPHPFSTDDVLNQQSAFLM